MGGLLREKVALITGASSGLGYHFAQVLADAGATVCIAARRRDRLKALEKDIKVRGGKALAVSMDVTKPKSVAKAMDILEKRLGPPDILVNNAGVAGSGLAIDTTEADWDAVVDTNLKGAWTVARETALRLRDAKKGGSIINIASILAFGVSPGVAPYAISKAGIAQMTKALALEWARYGIRVNALAPGYIATDMNRAWLESEAGLAMIKTLPQRRVGQPTDLDGPLLLLASDSSSYMTGAIIPVDGGHLVKSL